MMGYTTSRKCQQCKENIILEKEMENVLYYGEGKMFHKVCLEKKLLSNKRRKFTKEDIEILISDSFEESVGKIENLIVKNHLYKYLMEHYEIVSFPNYIYTKLEEIFLGKYRDMRMPVPPHHILDMFLRQVDFLDNIYHKTKLNGVSRVNYDIAVLLAKYPTYLDWLGRKESEEKKVEAYSLVDEKLTNLVSSSTYEREKIKVEDEDFFNEGEG